MSQIVERMVRAARLDPYLYEEVEADQTAMGQAMLVVILSSAAAGLGGAFAGGFLGLVGGTLAALFGWFLWAVLTYFIGTRLLPEPQTKADLGQLLRTIGFSTSPGILRVLGFIPVLGTAINFIAGVWMLMAMIIAVRQALDYQGTGRAIVVCLIGWAIYLIIGFLVAGLIAAGGAGS